MFQNKNQKYSNNITITSKNKKITKTNNVIKKKPNYKNKQNSVLNIKNNNSNIINKNINNKNELVPINQYSINPYNFSTAYSPMNKPIKIRLKRRLSDYILTNNYSNINNNSNLNNKTKRRLNLSNPEIHKNKSNSIIHIKSKTISYYDNEDNINIKKKYENKKLPFYINNYFYKQKISGGKIDLYNYDKNTIKIIKKNNIKDEKIIYIQKNIKGFLYRKIFKKFYKFNNFRKYFENYIMKINKENFLFFIDNIKKLYYNNNDNKKIIKIYKNNINNINIKEYINKNFKIKFNNNNNNNDSLKNNYNSNNNRNNVKKKNLSNIKIYIILQWKNVLN